MRVRPYFAYGSNMDLAQMGVRCPDARFVGRARLAGWRWMIMSRGYASIVEEPGAEVFGVLWRISDADEAALDRYEGVAEGHYGKREVPVERLDIGVTEPAMVYVSPDAEAGTPADRYLERVVAAARLQSLPEGYVRRLEDWLTPR